MVVAVRGWASLKAESNLPSWPRVPEPSPHDPPPSWGPDGPGIRWYVWASGGCFGIPAVEWRQQEQKDHVGKGATWTPHQPVSVVRVIFCSLLPELSCSQQNRHPTFFSSFVVEENLVLIGRSGPVQFLSMPSASARLLHFWFVSFVFPYTWTRVFSIPKQCVFASVDFLWMFWFNPCVLPFWICSPLFRDTFEVFSASIPLRLEGFFASLSDSVCPWRRAIVGLEDKSLGGSLFCAFFEKVCGVLTWRPVQVFTEWPDRFVALEDWPPSQGTWGPHWLVSLVLSSFFFF